MFDSVQQQVQVFTKNSGQPNEHRTHRPSPQKQNGSGFLV